MGLFGTDKIMLGFDLGNEYSQISYFCRGMENVETISQVAGDEDYNIPTALLKRKGVNQWFVGREALRYKDQGILVDHLLELALAKENVVIENESYEPVALLALFFRRALGMLSRMKMTDKIGGIMITTEILDNNMLSVLNAMVERIHLKADVIAFQSHMESYYCYMMKQPAELWNYQSVLFYKKPEYIAAYLMEHNKRTTPVVVYIDERTFPYGMAAGNVSWDPDKRFLEIAKQMCDGQLLSSIFLIGDGFEQEVLQDTLRYLCKKGRVFQGNNLFSKGACYGILQRVDPKEETDGYVFLGNDKLKANIGMKLYRRGEESYYAILDAGVNWYDASCDFCVYSHEGNAVEMIITPLIGKKIKTVRVLMEEFPAQVAKLHIHVSMESETVLQLEIEDLGFGQIRSASGKIHSEKIKIYE